MPQTSTGLSIFLAFLFYWIYARFTRTLFLTSPYQLLIPEK